MFFGDAIQGGFQITSTFVNPGGPAVRTFDTFSQPLAELIEARIWAGLHYRSADVQGQALGRNVANYAAANYSNRWATDHSRGGPVVTRRPAPGGPSLRLGGEKVTWSHSASTSRAHTPGRILANQLKKLRKRA